jgi:hypothetical protein
MNGLGMGKFLQSYHSFADIAKHISESMKMHLFLSIIELYLKIAVID